MLGSYSSVNLSSAFFEGLGIALISILIGYAKLKLVSPTHAPITRNDWGRKWLGYELFMCTFILGRYFSTGNIVDFAGYVALMVLGGPLAYLSGYLYGTLRSQGDLAVMPISAMAVRSILLAFVVGAVASGGLVYMLQSSNTDAEVSIDSDSTHSSYSASEIIERNLDPLSTISGTPLSLKQFKQKYPVYDRVPDCKLAYALHKKFYAEMSFALFLNKLGAGPCPSFLRK